MRKSPLSTPYNNRSHGVKRTPYNWKSPGSANDRGYQAQSNSYQRFSINNELQPSGDNFIPLNINTPVQYDKYNANRYSPASGRNNISPNHNHSPGWYNQRNSYHSAPRNCNYPHSAYKPFIKKRGSFKGKYEQSYTLDYVDMNSFLENPWEGLVKKLQDSKGTNENDTPEDEFLSNSKLINSDSVERSESKLPSEVNFDDLRCSKKFKDEHTTNKSLWTEDTELNQTSVNNSTDIEFGDICSSQSLPNKSVCSDDEVHRVTQKKDDTCSSILSADTDQEII